MGDASGFAPSLAIIGRVKPRHPYRITLGRHGNVMRRHEIIARFNPAAPVTLITDCAFGTMAHKVNLAIPLAIARTDRATHIKIAVARLARDAINGVGILRPGANDNAFFV
jgi:hypothetical protein